MTENDITSTLTPSVTYNDTRAGIRWLVNVLGFRVARIFDGPDGRVAFAELVWRNSIIFVSGKSDREPWTGVGPSSIALAAPSAEAVDRHYEHAHAASADIIRPIHDAVTPAFPEGSHQFDMRDPDGNLWTVGTFQPRAAADHK